MTTIRMPNSWRVMDSFCVCFFFVFQKLCVCGGGGDTTWNIVNEMKNSNMILTIAKDIKKHKY